MEEKIFQILNAAIDKINIGLLIKLCVETILFIVFLRLVNIVVNKVFKKIIQKSDDFDHKKQFNTVRVILISLADTLLFLFFGTNILEEIGIDMKPILATAGVFGVAIGFGAKRFVEDVISGLNILLTGQIRVGDVVKISNVEGTVEKITLTMVVLRSFDGVLHFIRNGLIDSISNKTRSFAYAVLEIGVSYKENIQDVLDVIKDLGKEIKQDEKYGSKILEDIEVLGLEAFLDSSILIKARIKTTPQSQWEVKRAFNLLVKEKFDEKGIEIPFPQVVVTKAD